MLNSVPQKSTEGFLYDFTDGQIFTTHPLYSVRPNALQIILYTDDIQICNPLGSYAHPNKLLMVYYTLGNIDPKFRSKLAAIRLLAIAKAEDVSQWGVDVVLQRILKDVDLLYNGVKIETSNGDMDLHGAVIAVCGDTLAQAHHFPVFCLRHASEHFNYFPRSSGTRHSAFPAHPLHSQ